MDKKELTHFNEAGEAHMVDVHEKEDTYRVAKACGEIRMHLMPWQTGLPKKGMCLE